jgi:hypothetical protein
MRIIRVGKFVDKAGKEHDFTQEKLKTIANNYSFSGQEDASPDIISHDDKSPRVGFIRKVYVGDDGNSLFAESEIHDDFAQAIGEGFYPSVSVRLNKDETKIQHIAHLGKEKPAIKGLGLPIFDFADGEDFVDFAEVNLDLLEQVTDIWAKEVRDALWKIQDQQRTMFDAIKNALGENKQPDGRSPLASFSEADSGRDEEVKLLKEENAKLRSEFAALKEKEAADFAEGLIASGKILPRQKALVVKDYLTSTESANFAEFKAEYENLPISPLFNKIPAPDGEKDAVDFSSSELADAANEYKSKMEKEGKRIKLIDAVEAVLGKGK